MKTVLLVDDEPNVRLLVRTTLDESECRVVESSDARSALESARREPPDLVLLDWTMPGESGIELTQRLRHDEVTARVPIVMLTARGQAKDREQALAAGCDHLLVKPFSPLELLHCVHEMLQRAPAREERVAEPTPAPLSAPIVEPSRSPALDPQLALFVRDLKLANARLAILGRLKSEFLQFVSHELKTPLYALSAVELLDAPDEGADQSELVGLLRHGYARLRHFVAKGLEYFEWAARESSPEGSLDFTALVAKTVGEMASRQVDGGRLRLHPCDGDARVVAESTGLATVVRVLVENALHFSSEEPVDVFTRTGGGRVALHVVDRGVGLSHEMASEIFHPFTSGDVKRHAEGTGLNLALARVIVEAHGGTIRAESDGLGRGATFVVDLPLDRTTP